ncbi:hypothetical protein LCGC14_1114540, partial [marine sediment metagenome]
GLVSQVSKSIFESVTRSPTLTIASELSGATGAGAARFATKDLPEGSIVKPLAEITGGVVGGVGPALATKISPTGFAIRKGREAVAKASLPFTERGAKFRAGEFLKKQVVSPEEAARKVTDPTIGGPPPVIATGEKRLVSLLNKIRGLDPVTDADEIKKISRSVFQLEQELRSQGFGSPEALRQVTNRRVASLELSMQKRVADAMETAQSKLDALPIAQRQSQESVIVRNELEGVMKKEFEKTQELWNDVPRDVKVDFTNSRQALKDITDNLSKAESGDVPSILRGSILAKKKAPSKVSAVVDAQGRPVVSEAVTKNVTTIREMQGLRSKLLETQRIARKDGKFNKARISGLMADAVLDDMDVGVDDALTVAISATRQFKDRFEKGIVGKILGREKTGAPSISPELTLDISIGRAGVRGSVDIDKVVVTPEARNATKRFLSKSFTETVTAKGTKPFSVKDAQKWIANNEEVLDQFPELRNQLSDINQAQQFASETSLRLNNRLLNLKDPKISTSSAFLNSEVGEEVANVFKSKNPLKASRELINQARKDPTGEALDGLRGSYIDFLIKKSSIGDFNAQGERALSGNTLQGFINQNRETLREVFNQDQLNRINRIAKELSLLELTDAKGLPRVAFEIDDIPSNFLGVASRITGAQIGRWIARFTGGGTVQTPGIVSDRFKKFAQHLTQDRAEQLIHDAVTSEDGRLLNALLLPIDKPTSATGQQNLKILNKRINIWLLGTGHRVIEDIQNDISEDNQSQGNTQPELAGP